MKKAFKTGLGLYLGYIVGKVIVGVVDGLSEIVLCKMVNNEFCWDAIKDTPGLNKRVVKYRKYN